MATYTFRATSTTASGVTTLDHIGEYDTLELAQAYITEWSTALNSASYGGGTWTVGIVNPE
jgi:hypothetical protein